MDPQYPIGKFNPSDTTPLLDVIATIEQFPARLRAAVAGITEAELDRPYREGGWTARQVVHHLADSHINSYTRFRLGLTEDRPTIRPYDEKKWAELQDAAHGPIDPSLALIDALHARWAALMKSMAPEDFERVLVHPERGEMTLDRTARIYAWHCAHHEAHIGIARGLRLTT